MITLIIFWFLGLVISAFTIVPALTCIFFGIPITRKLQKAGMLIENHPIIKRYSVSCALLIFLFIIITTLIYLLGSDSMMRGYIVSTVFGIIIGILKIGNNKNNVVDYVKMQQRYFSKSLGEVATFLIRK